jgi:hypothetical protein
MYIINICIHTRVMVKYLIPEHLDPTVSPVHWIGAVSVNALISVCDKVHGHTSHTLLRRELSAKAVHTKNNLQWFDARYNS